MSRRFQRLQRKVTGFPKDNKEENQQLSRKMKLRSKGCTEKMLSVKMLPAAVKEMEEEIVCYRW